ncbi:hypothetical protein Desmer_2432 [Desulfosporosinus meridiei DSM 13257]|uniref:Uncharacterized protein n=1 Tax=Desulfosporosinus meridiei (strain ATCC BAA-275 / DSM 13257 / KCTC 12902 / NCIMB 13706 / S10) TaxID=768704 RepID=J7IZ75_DESMD|nr:hypothetical protein Desmer_2432 [Desulfosporosinus meridiei DSM 13257]
MFNGAKSSATVVLTRNWPARGQFLTSFDEVISLNEGRSGL